MAQRDLYQVLGVARDASPEDIKKAYRKIALQYHPDRHTGSEDEKKAAEAVFKEASSAYAVLSDPDKRARYDRFGHAGNGSSGAEGFRGVEDIFSAFSDIFGEGVFGGGRRDGPQPGAHLQCEIEVTLEEAVLGASKTISLERPEPCDPCSGTGAKPGSKPQTCGTCRGAGVVQQSAGFFMMRTTCPRCGGAGQVITHPCTACRGRGQTMASKSLDVRVPPGVETGVRLRLPAQGEPGERGGPRGDLFCLIRVKPHPLFERHDNDLVCEIPISFTQAALGAEIEIPTLTGRGKVAVPKGAQPGDVVRLKGEGCPDLRSGRKGDLQARLAVEIPRKLSAEQEDLLRRFAAAEGRQVGPRQKGFFDAVKAYFKERDEGHHA